MAASAYSPTASTGYRATRRLTRGKLIAWAAIVGAHVAVLAGFVFVHIAEPPPPEQVLTVSLISEQAPAAEQSAPAPPAPTPPKPEPTLIASPRPTPSPMTAPQPPEVTPQPQAQPAPPSPAPPSTAPASPSPPSTAPSTAAAGAAPGPITPPNFTAGYLNNPGPVYPVVSRRQREQGVVMLKVLVSPQGAPEQVQLEKSSGYPALDSAALDVVKKRWKFAPAKQGDKAVSAWVAIPLSFELKNH